jgi:hypothetical protein
MTAVRVAGGRNGRGDACAQLSSPVGATRARKRQDSEHGDAARGAAWPPEAAPLRRSADGGRGGQRAAPGLPASWPTRARWRGREWSRHTCWRAGARIARRDVAGGAACCPARSCRARRPREGSGWNKQLWARPRAGQGEAGDGRGGRERSAQRARKFVQRKKNAERGDVRGAPSGRCRASPRARAAHRPARRPRG